MTSLQPLLESYRTAAATQRQAGTYFEELTVCYFKKETAYRELYEEMLPYATWAERRGIDERDAGIDHVAETFTGAMHAIQGKLYAPDYRVQRSDIDSFFAAFGKERALRWLS